MKRTASFTIAALGAALIVLSSCDLLAPGAGVTPASSPATSTTTKGEISIAVQPVSKVVLDLVAHMGSQTVETPAVQRTPSSRMFLGAGKIGFTVSDATTGGQVDAWEVFPIQTNVQGQTQAGTRSYDPGSYTLHADIYNDANDASPAVSGSASFSVTAGQEGKYSHVIVTCFPTDPDVLPQESTAFGPYELPNTWVSNWPSPVQVGSEQWFKVTPETGAMRDFTVTPASGSAACLAIFLFDAGSNSLGGSYYSSPGQEVSLTLVPTVPGATYYFGVIDFGDSSAGDRSFAVSYAQRALPVATSLDDSLGAWVPGTLGTGEVRLYSFSAIAGHEYAINWDNYVCGSGAYDKEMVVTGFHEDFTSLFSRLAWGYDGDTYYSYGSFNNFPAGNNAKTFTASTDETFYLLVQEPYRGSHGTSYAIMVTDLPQPQ